MTSAMVVLDLDDEGLAGRFDDHVRLLVQAVDDRPAVLFGQFRQGLDKRLGELAVLLGLLEEVDGDEDGLRLLAASEHDRRLEETYLGDDLGHVRAGVGDAHLACCLVVAHVPRVLHTDQSASPSLATHCTIQSLEGGAITAAQLAATPCTTCTPTNQQQ